MSKKKKTVRKSKTKAETFPEEIPAPPEDIGEVYPRRMAYSEVNRLRRDRFFYCLRNAFDEMAGILEYESEHDDIDYYEEFGELALKTLADKLQRAGLIRDTVHWALMRHLPDEGLIEPDPNR